MVASVISVTIGNAKGWVGVVKVQGGAKGWGGRVNVS